MINYVPKLLSRNPSREEGAPDLFKINKRDQESFKEKEKAARAAAEAQLKIIRDSCSVFRSSNPEQWRQFEDALTSTYNATFYINRNTPLDCQSQGIDPGYIPYIQQYTLGKLEILESILGRLGIEVVRKIEEVPKTQIIFQKTFFKKVVDLFRKSDTSKSTSGK